MRRLVERLAGAAVLAAAMMVAGCVAQAGDDDDDVVTADSAALVAVPDVEHPDLPLPADPDPAPANATIQKIGGGDNAGEPEPNPWKPGSTSPGDPAQQNTRR